MGKDEEMDILGQLTERWAADDKRYKEQREIDDQRVSVLEKDQEKTRNELGALSGVVKEIQGEQKVMSAGLADVRTVVGQGFQRMEAAIAARDSQPTKVSVGVIGSLVMGGVVLIGTGVGAFWVAVQLLFLPLKEDLAEHKSRLDFVPASSERMSLIEERSRNNATATQVAADLSLERDDRQRLAITDLQETVRALQVSQIESAKESGRQEIYNKWHSEWLTFTENQADRTRERSDAAGDAVSALQARMAAFEKQLGAVDNNGSRVWNKTQKQE